jgi:hypothetical protein
MWEVRAAPGRADELVAWVRRTALPELRAAGGLDRVEVFRGDEDRVVVVSVWADEAAALPDPPPRLVARAPHAWEFERVLREPDH